jgi:Putative Flp pilus-assembly TadE/G-like
MMNLYANRNRYDDRGVSILIIAVSMIFVLGMAGLGIDLASLYVGRNQSQRAADAGALAAGQYLASMGCTASSGSVSADCQAKAKNQAAAVTNANLIAGISPDVSATNNIDVKFLVTSANDPQVQVIAGRDTAHGNPMPTFFVKIFGIQTANVSAKAVAEAYNPSGGPVSSVSQCVKPWLMPNCDEAHLWKAFQSTPNNPNCQGSVQFTNTPYPTPANFDPTDAKPALSEDQTRGELMTLKSSDPSQASAPSQFYPVYLPPGSVASSCPSCANGGGGSGPNSGSLYRQNIECCNTSAITCGPQTIQPITGNMVGPTGQGVDCLIHQNGSSGQDIMTVNSSGGGDLWTITAGSANPYGLSGNISTSDSIVTVPLYDGTTLCPGKSCPSQVTTVVVGFLQVFLVGETNGNVQARIMNIVGCPDSSSPSGGTTPVGGGGASPIPVRLIHE